MPPYENTLRVKNIDGHVIIVMTEDITLSRLPAFREFVKTHVPDQYESLWFDLTHVSYIDSAGISFLLGTLSKARTLKKRYGVINPQQMVMKVFEIAHLTKAIPVVDSETSAIRPVLKEPEKEKKTEESSGSSFLGFFRRSR